MRSTNFYLILAAAAAAATLLYGVRHTMAGDGVAPDYQTERAMHLARLVVPPVVEKPIHTVLNQMEPAVPAVSERFHESALKEAMARGIEDRASASLEDTDWHGAGRFASPDRPTARRVHRKRDVSTAATRASTLRYELFRTNNVRQFRQPQWLQNISRALDLAKRRSADRARRMRQQAMRR